MSEFVFVHVLRQISEDRNTFHKSQGCTFAEAFANLKREVLAVGLEPEDGPVDDMPEFQMSFEDWVDGQLVLTGDVVEYDLERIAVPIAPRVYQVRLDQLHVNYTVCEGPVAGEDGIQGEAKLLAKILTGNYKVAQGRVTCEPRPDLDAQTAHHANKLAALDFCGDGDEEPTCNEERAESGLPTQKPCAACHGGACIDR